MEQRAHLKAEERVQTQRPCTVCRTTHRAFIWLYQEEVGQERLYLCLEAYLQLPAQQYMWRRLYEPQ
jgi:hypothetical protein